MNELNGKQRRFLRGLGNRLKPSVNVGKEGVSPELLRSIEDAYANHELIKIKLERGCPRDRKEVGPVLARETDSHLVQILGQTVLLYRGGPRKSRDPASLNDRLHESVRRAAAVVSLIAPPASSRPALFRPT